MKSANSDASLRRTRGILLFAVWLFGSIPQQVVAGAPVPVNKPNSYPDWWFEREVVRRVDTSNASPSWPTSYFKVDDFGAVNQGQLKHMADRAGQEMSEHFPGGAGLDVESLIDGFRPLNLAVKPGVVASQSSTGWDAPASRAIDGNTNGDFFGGQSVSHTYQDVNPWLQVDLGSSRTIRSVEIWNRTDGVGWRTCNFYVFVSNVDLSQKTLNDILADTKVWRSPKMLTAPDPTLIVNVGAVTGQYVMVCIEGTQFLHLAELKVNGDIAPNRSLTENHAAVNIGQLKAAAAPFHDRFIELGQASGYPWEKQGKTADDFAIANIGQVKQLFSFDRRDMVDLRNVDTDVDGFPDWWERFVSGTNPSLPDIDIGNPNDNGAPALPGTSPMSGAGPHNDILPPEEIFSPISLYADAVPPPIVAIVNPFETDDGEKASLFIKHSPEAENRIVRYTIWRRELSPGDANPSEWTARTVLNCTPGTTAYSYEDSVEYNVLYWYRIEGRTATGSLNATEVSYAAPLRFRFEAQRKDLSVEYTEGRLAEQTSEETYRQRARTENWQPWIVEENCGSMDRDQVIAWAFKTYSELDTSFPINDYFREAGWLEGNTGHYDGDYLGSYREQRVAGTDASGRYNVEDEVAISGSPTITVTHTKASAKGPSSLGPKMKRVFINQIDPRAVPSDGPYPCGRCYILEDGISIPRDESITTSLIPKADAIDSNRKQLAGSYLPIAYSDDGGGGAYGLLVDPVILLPFKGGNSMLPLAFRQSKWAEVTPGDTVPIGISVLTTGIANMEISLSWADPDFVILAEENGVWTELESGGKIPPNWSQLVMRIPTASAVGRTVQLSVALTRLGDVLGSDAVSVKVGAGDSPEILAGYTIPIDEASGASYRKIALNGRPISDSKPQAEIETDIAKEETFIDALTLSLRHSTSDVHLPVPGADFSLSVRRDVAAEVWTTRSGLRPHERPDRPFGLGWTSNLGGGLEVVVPSDGGPVLAYATDLNGATHKFFGLPLEGAIIPAQGARHLIDYEFVPIPSGRHELSSHLQELKVSAAGGSVVWRFRGRNGGWVEYECAGIDSATLDTKLVRKIMEDREKGSIGTVTHGFYRIKRGGDRLNNSVEYLYAGNPSLVPNTIRSTAPDGTPTGYAIHIAQNSRGLITDVWDALGRCQYRYVSRPYVSAITGKAYQEWTLSEAVRPDGAVITYGYNVAQDVDVHTPADGPDFTRTTFLHAEIGSIKDPRGNLTSFDLQFDRTKFSYHSKTGYFVQTGRPRWIRSVATPAGTATFLNAPADQSGWGLKLRPDFRTASINVINTPVRYSQVTDAAGEKITYTWTDPRVILVNDLRQMMRDPRGLPRLIFYQAMAIDYGIVPKEPGAPPALPATEKFTFKLDAGMAIGSVEDLSGNVTRFEYGDEFTYPGSLATLFTIGGYNGRFSEPTKQVNAAGKEKNFTYISQATADGRSVRLLGSVIDESGRVTTYGFDSAAGRRTKEIVSKPGETSHETTWAYESAKYPGVPTRRTVKKLGGDSSVASSITTEYLLELADSPDATGRVLKEIVDPGTGGLNLTTTYSYDGNGNKRSITDPRDNLTGFSYDACNRLVKIDRGGDALEHFGYDLAGNKIRHTDENGNVTQFTYDTANRLTKIEKGASVTQYGYNSIGSRITVTDPNGKITRTDYDKLQRPEKVTDALGQVTRFWYGTNSGGSAFDVSGFKPTRIEDPRGVVTTYAFDQLYRQSVKKVYYAPGLNASW